MKTSPKLLLVFKVSSFCHFIQQSSIPEYGSYYSNITVSEKVFCYTKHRAWGHQRA